MSAFVQKLRLVFADSMLRKRILFVLGALIVFRLLATIPIPGIDAARLEAFFAGSQFFGLLNLFSGGGLSNLSIVMLGVGPYITASIIMQLLTMMWPRLKALYHEEGELGRARFAQYSRLLTIPLAIVQAVSFLTLLSRNGVVSHLGAVDFLVNVSVITAGSLLLMWIGELITEFGAGNGVSLIIFAGIVAALPTHVSQFIQTFNPAMIPQYILFLVVALVVILGVVIVTEAERPIPVTYAKRVRGNKVFGGISTYLPLRLNQAGVIPIIFALSILLFPQMIFNFLTASNVEAVASFSRKAVALLSGGWLYGVLYFIFVFLFTYFYTAVTFDPHAIAENLQKSGAFIPGVRPGESTSDFVARIVTRITLVGALFLGFIAILPLAIQGIMGGGTLAIGGTALLIVVSVVIDLIKKIDAQVSMREY